jgi:hypothetical protein
MLCEFYASKVIGPAFTSNMNVLKAVLFHSILLMRSL